MTPYYCIVGSKTEALTEFYKPISLESKMEEGGETWTCQNQSSRKESNPCLRVETKNNKAVPRGFIIPAIKCPASRKYRLGSTKSKSIQIRDEYIEANYAGVLEWIRGSTKW